VRCSSNVAAAPTFAKLGYPQLAVAAVTDLGPQQTKKYPRFFLANGTITQYSSSVIDVLKKLRDGGKMGNKVAMVNVADEYGLNPLTLAGSFFRLLASIWCTTSHIRWARRNTHR
jgi:branched-chain amino acid transport system substrate-binding protein